MEPNFKLLFDKLAHLNRRFDEQDDHWSRRFSVLERVLTERSATVDIRLDSMEAVYTTTTDALARHLADLESAPVDPQALVVEQRVASLKANYADRDA
jgi:hypothetical protein